MKRPIYLFSKTPYTGVTHIPILDVDFLQVPLDFSHYDALVITSKQALLALQQYNPDWKKVPIIAISKPTADQAEAMGATLLHVGKGYGTYLYEIINAQYSSLRLCYARAEVIVSDFALRLKKEGVTIDDPIVYKTTCNDSLTSLSLEEDAILVFTSPSAVRCFLKNNTFQNGQRIVAIGATTQKAIPLHVKSVLPKHPTLYESVELAKKISSRAK